MKKVLILTVSLGMGHNASAKAIEDELISSGDEVITLDVYQYINKILSETLNLSAAIYAKLVPDLYRTIYSYLDRDTSEDSGTFISIIHGLCATKFEKLLDDFKPDIIVCTHVFAAQIIDEIKKRKKTFAKLIGIITDYTIHPYWQTVSTMDYYLIANEKLRYRAIRKGIPDHKIKAFGIPVNPKFNIPITKEEARCILGLDTSYKVILVMGGGLGFGVGVDEIADILKADPYAHILVICGKNKKLYNKFDEYKDENETGRLHIYGYVDNVHIMMSAADIFVSKPGGISATEAFMKNLPMVIINPLAGQEERNAEFMMNCGLALQATKTFTLDEAVNLLINDKIMIEEITDNIKRIINKNSTKDICDFINNI